MKNVKLSIQRVDGGPFEPVTKLESIDEALRASHMVDFHFKVDLEQVGKPKPRLQTPARKEETVKERERRIRARHDHRSRS